MSERLLDKLLKRAAVYAASARTHLTIGRPREAERALRNADRLLLAIHHARLVNAVLAAERSRA